MIYLITCKENNTCKIGLSSNPKRRLAQLQTSSSYKLHLDTIIDGDCNVEKELHEKFKSFKLMGEWFTYDNSIKEFFKPYTKEISITKFNNKEDKKLIYKLSPCAKELYIWLLFEHDSKLDTIYINTAIVMKDCKTSLNTVKKAVLELINNNILKVTKLKDVYKVNAKYLRIINETITT